MRSPLNRIDHKTLANMLASETPPVLLDVRRQAAFERMPEGLSGAVPLVLDTDEPQIPDLPRDTPMVTYCLCNGEASSTRAALWLVNAGYQKVSVLSGGLPAWQTAGLEVAPINMDASALEWRAAPFMPEEQGSESGSLVAQPLLAEQSFLTGQTLPIRRDMAVLFVDMVDSTPLLFRHSNERVLEIVQAFMAVVVDVAVHHCGDVHDFEGDGAMLYFAGPGEAVPAAFRLRKALRLARESEPDIPEARISIDAGPVVIGHIGSRYRRSLSFIGPCVNTAARILKLAPADHIAVTEKVYRYAEAESPDLINQFDGQPHSHTLKGIEGGQVKVFVSL